MKPFTLLSWNRFPNLGFNKQILPPALLIVFSGSIKLEFENLNYLKILRKIQTRYYRYQYFSNFVFPKNLLFFLKYINFYGKMSNKWPLKNLQAAFISIIKFQSIYMSVKLNKHFNKSNQIKYSNTKFKYLKFEIK